MHVDEGSPVQFYASMRPTIAGHGNLAGSREEEIAVGLSVARGKGLLASLVCLVPALLLGLPSWLASGLLACYCWATMVMLFGQRMGPSLSLNLGLTKNIKSKTKIQK